MRDLGQALEEKVEQIVEDWIRAVHRDAEIESARKLAYEAVRDSLPDVLHELASLLSRYQLGDLEELEEKSLYHGFIRAQQGYDTAEIMREYRLLRQVVMIALEPDLLTGTPVDILRATRAINDVVDEIITDSLEEYIEARLTEVRQIQSQLTLTNQELNRLVQAQKDNISFMAHELKTPLNSIIGHSTLLLQQQRKKLKAKDTAVNLDQLEKVLRNGRKLLQIINDALEIARYNEGQIQLNLEPVDVGELVQGIVEDSFGPLALEKELTLEVNVDKAPGTVMADSLRLQQIINNLVSNAIRCTESGSVRVLCSQVSSEVWEITVADTGIGIAEEDQTRIFNPYVQASSQTQMSGTAGLGLSIVQRIVELIDGTIQLTSEVGRGSVFTITFPLIKP